MKTYQTPEITAIAVAQNDILTVSASSANGNAIISDYQNFFKL